MLDALRAAGSATGGAPGIVQTLEPNAYPGVRNFHILCDVLTIATLWAIERRRRRLAPIVP